MDDKIPTTKTESLPGHLLAETEAAIAWEHALTPRRAFRLYAKAIRYGALVSMALIMEGMSIACRQMQIVAHSS